MRNAPRHGLDEATVAQINAQAKELRKTMPPRANIPGDAEYSITIDNKKLAIYCRHCDYFTKGKSTVCTPPRTTKEPRVFVPTQPGPASAPAPSPAPAPAPSPAPAAGGYVASLPSGFDLNSVPVISTESFCQPINQGLASYDFGSMPAFRTNLASAGLSCIPEDIAEDIAEDDAHLIVPDTLDKPPDDEDDFMNYMDLFHLNSFSG